MSLRRPQIFGTTPPNLTDELNAAGDVFFNGAARADAAGLDAVFLTPAFTLDPGDFVNISATMFARVTARYSGSGFCDPGPGCALDAGELSEAGAEVLSLNTGQISLSVPQGVELDGFPNNPAWVTTTPIPLPAGALLLITAPVGLALAGGTAARSRP